jgi:hypothetical protein
VSHSIAVRNVKTFVFEVRPVSRIGLALAWLLESGSGSGSGSGSNS